MRVTVRVTGLSTHPSYQRPRCALSTRMHLHALSGLWPRVCVFLNRRSQVRFLPGALRKSALYQEDYLVESHAQGIAAALGLTSSDRA